MGVIDDNLVKNTSELMKKHFWRWRNWLRIRNNWLHLFIFLHFVSSVTRFNRLQPRVFAFSRFLIVYFVSQSLCNTCINVLEAPSSMKNVILTLNYLFVTISFFTYFIVYQPCDWMFQQNKNNNIAQYYIFLTVAFSIKIFGQNRNVYLWSAKICV